MSLNRCIDDQQEDGCEGDVYEYLSMSGSGIRYARCEHHYAAYVERMRPIMEDIAKRYPDRQPDDFDPTYCGEVWDEEDY